MKCLEPHYIKPVQPPQESGSTQYAHPHRHKLAARVAAAAVSAPGVQAQLPPPSRATLALVLAGKWDAEHPSSSARTGEKSPAWPYLRRAILGAAGYYD